MDQLKEDIIFEAGEVLFDTKVPLRTALFILEGKVDMVLAVGQKKLELQFGENQFIGDAAVVVEPKINAGDTTYHSRAVASSKVRAVAIPIEDIKQELENCPPLLRAWFASFVSRILIIIEKLAE